MKARRDQVFISYSHHDKVWLERLQVHLRPLEREGRLERWDDTRIQAGGKWRTEIRHALASAKVAILLISADFLASDFIVTEELPLLLTAAKAEGTIILPVIISPSQFERTPFAQFQSINPISRPLIGLPKNEQEGFFVQVANTVDRALTLQPTNKVQTADGTTGSAGHISMGDQIVGGHRVVTWINWKNKRALLGAGTALLVLLFGWHFVLSKPVQSNVEIHNQGGVATGGDLKAGIITIIGSNPTPHADKALTSEN